LSDFASSSFLCTCGRARTIIAQTRPETIIVMLKKPAARKNSC
jgi:hypothetical protein